MRLTTDALVVGRPATVQNSYAPHSEKGASVTDQRQRFAVSWVLAPKPFHRDQEWLSRLFNDWKVSGVITVARTTAKRDGDGRRQSGRQQQHRSVGPDYATTDLRLTRKLHIGERLKVNWQSNPSTCSTATTSAC
jgi:hypothetical protein